MTNGRENEGPHLLAAGTSVEVANQFVGTWASGFEVIDADQDGYRLRRLSDSVTLPVTIAPERVRARPDAL